MTGDATRNPVLRATGIRKVYHTDAEDLQVLSGIDLTLTAGQTLAITGASGVGKSTLLHILGGLDRPTEGQLHIAGTDVFALTDDDLAAFRNRHVGFVFQFHNLLPEFSALENVQMPALIAGHDDGLHDRARELLEEVGLGHRLAHRPGELSGGECQRVAVARALVMHPQLVLADEPSGNLDPDASAQLHDLLRGLARSQGQAIVVMTHDGELAASLDRTGRIAGGTLNLD